ncbi:hypothetical protein VHEMI08156 [[Torrubiella] hemipterigena]|uniref:DUF7598 domain-containing protein n=1 Tax=[Torrubiella] hemipterigena TaxID=1531966 RepID=A0A0A1T5Q0_9HYPO|nr:hypothetical protein VHEMI08156 [[Torrubiella] hemipterigena]
MGIFSKTALRGAGYWVLQALRVFTVISLLAAVASCWVLMIKVDKGRTFFVFECISLFFTSVIAIALIVSEFPMVSFIRNYFRQAWPVLSESYGVGWLGAAMVVIGCNVLGSLNEPGFDPENLGSNFTSLVQAGGILCLIFGALNVLASLIWRDGKEKITSRDIRADGSLAKQRDVLPSSYSASAASSVHREKQGFRQSVFSVFGKRPQNGGAAGKTTIPIISGPIYTHPNPECNNPPPNYALSSPNPTTVTSGSKESPVVRGVMRPPTAEHPMLSGGLAAPPAALKAQKTGTSSIYSTDGHYARRYSQVNYKYF